MTAETSALCAEIDPELFFPGKGGSTRTAKQICSQCSIREACLDTALHTVVDGIWAGTTKHQRAKIRAERGIVASVLGYDTRPHDRTDQVARLAAQGWDIPSIAANLGISTSSVYVNLRRAHDQAESA